MTSGPVPGPPPHAAGAFAAQACAVVTAVGGAANVLQLTHCLVRLRLVVADRGLVDECALRALPGVALVVWQAGQLQLALQVPVREAHRAVSAALASAAG